MQTPSYLDESLALSESANQPFPWLISARRLLHSAYLLDSSSEHKTLYKDVRNVARMCMGMAIECYFKAYYVASGNVLHDGSKQRTFGSHDLAQMADEVCFAVTPEQKKVLHYLSMWVRVKGRYPVPLRLSDMKIHPSDENDNPFDAHLLVWDDNSDDQCMKLVREAETRIAAKHS